MKNIFTLLLLTIPGFINRVIAQTQVSQTYSVDGVVNALASKGDTLIVGGSFGFIGKYREGMSIFTTASDQPDPGFPRIVGEIRSSTPDGSGGFYLYGNFRKVSEPEGSSYSRIEHLMSNYSFDANFSLEVNYWNIRDIFFYDNILYIAGGQFDDNGLNSLCGYDVINNQFVGWLPVIDGGSKEVVKLFGKNNTLYISGGFTTVGSATRNYVAAIELYSGAVKPWAPVLNGNVGDMLSYKDKIVLGGNFSDGTPFGQHACVMVDTSNGQTMQWEFMASGLFGDTRQYLYWAAGIEKMAINGDVLFTKSSGTFDTRITAIDLTNQNIETNKLWAKYFTLTDKANGMVFKNNAVFVVGNFTGTYTTDSVNDNKFFERKLYGSVKLNANTGDLVNWYPDCVGNGNGSYEAKTVSLSGNKVFIGGRFTHVNGKERTGIAMLNTNTNQVLPFSMNAQWTTSVSCMKISGNALYSAGSVDLFDTNNNVTYYPYAVTNLTTGVTTGKLPNTLTGYVNAIEVAGNYVFLGGGLNEISGTRKHLFAIDKSTNALATWAPNPNDHVRALLVANGKLYTGGYFTAIADSARNRIAAFNISNFKITKWNPGAESTVNAFAYTTGTIWAGGNFSKIGEINASKFAGISESSGVVTHALTLSNWGECNTLLAQGKNVVLGGSVDFSSDMPCRDFYIYDTINRKLIPDSVLCITFGGKPITGRRR